MNWSDKQLRVYDEWENTKNNLAVNAAPGSGKTTVLLELLKRTPPYLKSIFLAFNKSIQLELQKKVPEGVEALTLHSLGFRTLLRNTDRKYEVNEIKNWILGKNILDLKHLDYDKQSIHLFMVSALVDLYRINLCENEQDLVVIADKRGIDYSGTLLQDAMKLIEYLHTYNTMDHEKKMLIDFVDMLYLPTMYVAREKFPKYNVVMIDECQDLNRLQWRMIQMLFKPRTRFVAVGDPFQSIYAFQGADKDVFEQIKQYPNTTTLPLSYSYRCSRNIVSEANKVFNFIESPDWMEEGVVIHDGVLDSAEPGDFILCRNNKPLIDTFLQLLKNGQKATIMGKDYGKSLLNVLNKLDDFSEESKDKLIDEKIKSLKERGIKKPTRHESYISLVEKINILDILHEHYDTIDNLKGIIERMFSDKEDKDAIILSTIHKSKGLEAERVFIIGYKELLPSAYAETEIDFYAENCLKYVGVTRAKKELVFVNLNGV